MRLADLDEVTVSRATRLKLMTVGKCGRLAVELDALLLALVAASDGAEVALGRKAAAVYLGASAAGVDYAFNELLDCGRLTVTSAGPKRARRWVVQPLSRVRAVAVTPSRRGGARTESGPMAGRDLGRTKNRSGLLSGRDSGPTAGRSLRESAVAPAGAPTRPGLAHTRPMRLPEVYVPAPAALAILAAHRAQGTMPTKRPVIAHMRGTLGPPLPVDHVEPPPRPPTRLQRLLRAHGSTYAGAVYRLFGDPTEAQSAA